MDYKAEENRKLAKEVNLEFPYLDIKQRQLIYLFTINKRDDGIKKVFDDIDNHIGLWVAKDKNSKPNLVEPQWYKELKKRHPSTSLGQSEKTDDLNAR